MYLESLSEGALYIARDGPVLRRARDTSERKASAWKHWDMRGFVHGDSDSSRCLVGFGRLVLLVPSIMRAL